MKVDLLRGSLDLLVLHVLDTLGELPGYGIGVHVRVVTDGVIDLNQGTLHPCLVRLEQAALISASWGRSDAGRRARMYRLTEAGERRLAFEREKWGRLSTAVAQVLAFA